MVINIILALLREGGRGKGEQFLNLHPNSFPVKAGNLTKGFD
jgi:hypothetical protein